MKAIPGVQSCRVGGVEKVLLSAALICAAHPAWSQTQLPDGPGKELVQSACAQCHSLNRVTGAGYTLEGWQRVVRGMVTLGAPLTEDQIPVVIEYLATNFPDRAPKAMIIPGNVEVRITEWAVPTPVSRPHDPAVAPDGSVWYTGQIANVLGRFDPQTEQFIEYRLPFANSGPHGLTADKDGHIWYTANSAGYVGKLDPNTGEVTRYDTPGARDPHTPILDRRGRLWFTAQGANMVGRILPESGEVKLVTVPTPRSNPYGIVVDSKGVPWFDEFGGNRLASIDPETMEVQEYSLPNAAARPRRIAITSDDVLWYTDYARGYLGSFNPKTLEVREWPSPSGAQSQPYGIAVFGDVVWYSESGVSPNTVVRFDPQTQEFQTWPIPSGGGVVRNMMFSPDGTLWLACSGVNGIARVEIQDNKPREYRDDY